MSPCSFSGRRSHVENVYCLLCRPPTRCHRRDHSPIRLPEEIGSFLRRYSRSCHNALLPSWCCTACLIAVFWGPLYYRCLGQVPSYGRGGAISHAAALGTQVNSRCGALPRDCTVEQHVVHTADGKTLVHTGSRYGVGSNRAGRGVEIPVYARGSPWRKWPVTFLKASDVFSPANPSTFTKIPGKLFRNLCSASA